jgi:hypothetical protein
LYQQQASAALTIGVIDHLRLARPTAVSNRDLHHGSEPSDLHREPGTLPARGVQNGVAAQLVSDAEHIIARWAIRQQRRQPVTHYTKLTLLTPEHLAPS